MDAILGKQSFLLEAEDMRAILIHKNQILEAQRKQAEEAQNQVKSMEEERNEIREKLAVELNKEEIDINAIVLKQVAEQTEILNEKHRKEKEEMNGYLQSKIDKNLKLELQLDEIKDAYRSLESTMSTGDKTFKQKFEQLESTID